MIRTADITLTLPAAADGLSFEFRAATTVAKYLRFDPAGSEVIWLDGSALVGGRYVFLATVAEGDKIVFEAVPNSSGGWDWEARTQTDTWDSEGA